MARWRFMAVALLALTLAGSSTQRGQTQQDSTTGHYEITQNKPAEVDRSCVMYSLTDMGYDVDLGKWIAQTIPEMIEPSSWQSQGGSGVLRYYAPKNILIVKQSKSIQGKVDGFLKDLKSSMPKASATNSTSKKPPHASVTLADFREPTLQRTSNPVSDAQPYPVPTAVKAPKHLFHFIIRYEGDGIIDDNVVKFMKSQLQGAKSPVGVGLLSTVPCAPAVPPAVSETPPSPSSYAVPAGAVPNGSYAAPSAAPALNEGSPVPSTAPAPPSPAPKKKKEKKEDQMKTTATH